MQLIAQHVAGSARYRIDRASWVGGRLRGFGPGSPGASRPSRSYDASGGGPGGPLGRDLQSRLIQNWLPLPSPGRQGQVNTEIDGVEQTGVLDIPTTPTLLLRLSPPPDGGEARI